MCVLCGTATRGHCTCTSVGSSCVCRVVLLLGVTVRARQLSPAVCVVWYCYWGSLYVHISWVQLCVSCGAATGGQCTCTSVGSSCVCCVVLLLGVTVRAHQLGPAVCRVVLLLGVTVRAHQLGPAVCVVWYCYWGSLYVHVS